MAVDKLTHYVPSWEYEGNHGSIYSTWTATYDGIGIAVAVYNSSGYEGHWYVKDTTQNEFVVKLAIDKSNGSSQSAAFPIIKGHVYDGTEELASLTNVKLFCYKFK